MTNEAKLDFLRLMETFLKVGEANRTVRKTDRDSTERTLAEEIAKSYYRLFDSRMEDFIANHGFRPVRELEIVADTARMLKEAA